MRFCVWGIPLGICKAGLTLTALITTALGQEFLPMAEHVGQKDMQRAQTEKEKDEDEGKSHSGH